MATDHIGQLSSKLLYDWRQSSKNDVQDTRVEWEHLGEGASGGLTEWLGRACPMVVEHTRSGIRNEFKSQFCQVPAMSSWASYFFKISISHL